MDPFDADDRSAFSGKVAWLEPLLLATLGLNGLASAFDQPDHHLELGIVALALGALALVQLFLPSSRTPMVLARSSAVLLASFAFLIDTGGTRGFFLNGLVVACTAYPFLLPGALGFAVPAAASVGYVALMSITDDGPSFATVITRCLLLSVLAFATHQLRRSYERDDARLRDSYRHLADRARHERAVLEALPHPTAIIGDDGVIHGANQHWKDLCHSRHLDDGLGASVLTWLGRSVGGGGQVAEQLQAGLAELFTGRTMPFEIDVHLVSMVDGVAVVDASGDASGDPNETPWYQLTIAPLASVDGGAMITVVDVSASVLNELMARRLRTDSLTGLPNRVHFLEELHQSAHPSRRSADQLAVMFIDLDHFKEVNDVLGHDAGDLLLIGAARRLREELRPDDLLARLGGDEFVALCRRVPDSETAELVASRLVAALEQPFELPQGTARVSASIGIALASRWHANPVDLVSRADQAMYQAKRAGRGRGAVYSEPIIDLRDQGAEGRQGSVQGER
ncbi:MAG: diguanylate cyclase [Acidimicrobiia bacterium]